MVTPIEHGRLLVECRIAPAMPCDAMPHCTILQAIGGLTISSLRAAKRRAFLLLRERRRLNKFSEKPSLAAGPFNKNLQTDPETARLHRGEHGASDASPEWHEPCSTTAHD
ncbi:hypothetical protein [Panacagrimonas perspica]|uniref:hypothetical protein n=1 Tax=Panacagrimonas perspica TaxID=381431 RepID=UPI0013C2C810|nr:hypothetical protein [Panacagrimonas perspica]